MMTNQETLSPERILPVAQLLHPDAMLNITKQLVTINNSVNEDGEYTIDYKVFDPHSADTCVKLMEKLNIEPKRWSNGSSQWVATGIVHVHTDKFWRIGDPKECFNTIQEAVFACALKIVESIKESTNETS